MTNKTISVSHETHRELTKRGFKGESYDAIIRRLLNDKIEVEKVEDENFYDKIGIHLESGK